ncbi:lysosomal acid phosphatase-like [Homalodisca vitripennis]|uniref:lysosomal acid phosphatase-like n=1 Tax=Homalodisca vitripennis TaxID=197043 RepID=UPI001EEA2A16|nr:lysosomal acid phosphatase-like [Homalodisca vitripennis]
MENIGVLRDGPGWDVDHCVAKAKPPTLTLFRSQIAINLVGQQQMFKVGQNLKKRYGDFVGGYTQEKVHVSATNISTRTTVSSLCVMAGQFPPYKPIFKDLPNWQPIPVWQNTSDFDKAYLISNAATCPRYATILRKSFERINKPDPTRERQVIYKVLQNFTGDPNVDNVGSVAGIFDNIRFEDLNGLPVPTWATQPQPQFKNRPLYPDLLGAINLEFFYEAFYPNRDKNSLQFYAGPIVNSVQEQLKINSNQGDERYRFHGTSDSSVFALLNGIGVEVKSLIEPGDGVLFEIHREDTGPIVQVLYYRGLQHTFEKLTLPSCPDPCTVDNFIKTTLGLTPQQWQQRCFM